MRESIFNRKVSTPIVLLAIAVLAALVYVAYNRTYGNQPFVNPGLADIPPHHPGDDKPGIPPKDAGQMPGTKPR